MRALRVQTCGSRAPTDRSISATHSIRGVLVSRLLIHCAKRSMAISFLSRRSQRRCARLVGSDPWLSDSWLLLNTYNRTVFTFLATVLYWTLQDFVHSMTQTLYPGGDWWTGLTAAGNNLAFYWADGTRTHELTGNNISFVRVSNFGYYWSRNAIDAPDCLVNFI